jgi:hypothetical protein
VPVHYSIETANELGASFDALDLDRPRRIDRYEPGSELTYEITGVATGATGQMKLRIEKAVGGGFAGQVYRVEVLELTTPPDSIPNLHVGGFYALKILIPPKASSLAFRNFVYAVGFQSPFSLQVNPTAARAGALWQTLIRRAASLRFENERAVTEIHATFIDHDLGSCGEISEWIDGRCWRFETDDHLETRKEWQVGDSLDGQASKEYLAKKTFMAEIVRLLHDMGAPELARQYEWWTCKSQPNCLKRTEADGDPAAGLTAVDFRAGLALLPFLPMSPGDVPLIAKGLGRGSLVQFDRGNLKKLHAFVESHREHFTGMENVVDELVETETAYRNSMPDVTHNHVRLLYSKKLWGNLMDSAVTGWRTRNLIDDTAEGTLRKHPVTVFGFAALKAIPVLGWVMAILSVVSAIFSASTGWPTAVMGIVGAILISRLGGILVRMAGRDDFNRHYHKAVSEWDYFKRTWYGHVLEATVAWHHEGRLSAEKTKRVEANPWLYVIHRPLSFLPIWLHHMLTDWGFCKVVAYVIFVRPIRLFFNAGMREEWLRDMLKQGQRKGMLTDEDAAKIESQIPEPFIQKYLKSLTVHACTAPITQVVAAIVAIIYIRQHPEFTWEQAWGYGLGIMAAFQITPVSPGSMVRGLYVVYLVIRERNFKDYNIAVFLGFFKYIGYLAFPIQMAYRYPTLSRFMAGNFATNIVHVIPVFGEQGAVLEHAAFDLFFNYPLTVRRRIPLRNRVRALHKPRYWHVPVATVACTGAFAALTVGWHAMFGSYPSITKIWWATFLIPLLAGRWVLKHGGGCPSTKRIFSAIGCGLLMGLLTGLAHAWIIGTFSSGAPATNSLKWTVQVVSWRMFAFTLFAVIGAVIAEVCPREPRADLVAQLS